MGALTDSRVLPSLPLCSDERRDWIAAPCNRCRVQQSNRGTRPGKAAAVAGSSSSRAALNEPPVALVPSIGLRGCSRHPRAPFPPTAVTAGHRFRRLDVGMQSALLAMRQVRGGSAAARGTQCCRSVTEGARSTPRPSFDPPCSRSAIRSDRARSESDDASWRRSTGSAESASESRVE